jgi:hypothetical protein
MPFRCIGGVLVLAGLAGCAKRAPPHQAREGPVLSITVAPSPSSQAARPIAQSAVTLALAGLPSGELVRLRERMAAATDDAIRRAAPTLFVDLEDDASGDGAEPLHPALPDVPALTAAANLSGAPWAASGISVDLGPTCVPGTRCVALFPATTSDRLEGRARALAWALTDAAILRVSPQARAAFSRSLREKGLGPTTIALVFDTSEGDLDEQQLGPLREEARRALKHLDAAAPSRAWVESMGKAEAHWKLPVTLGRDEILVVPRLSALARLPAFEADLSSAGEFAWVIRPRAADR